jgi:hypothetical protein
MPARVAALTAAVAVSSFLSGCAAFRPMDGVPARYLPDELRGCSKESMQMIDLSMLRRRPEAQYRVDSGDVLAVYIENILGRADQPPINQQTGSSFSQLNGDRPPTLGYPLTIRDDGTIAIPRFGPILVRGRTIPEVENLVRSAFTQQQRYLTPMTQNRVVVSLHQPRKYRVLVFRQDSENGGALSTIDISNGQIGNSNRGNGKVVALPSGKNDVLHALVESGGLPGLDARDTIWVIRSKQTPKPINQVAYNGIPQRGAPIPTYPQQPMMQPGFAPGYPMMQQPQQMMPGPRPMMQQPMMPQPGYQPMQQHQGPLPQPGATMPGHAGPAVGSTDSGHGTIQQAGYWMMQTPKQIAENLTGIPMPPREGPGPLAAGHSAITRGVRNAVGAVTGAGAVAASAVAPNDFDQNGVLPAGCQSCQTGSQMPMGAPNYGPPMMAPPQYSPGPQMMNGPWQPPAAWNQIPGMNTNGLCNLGRTIRIPLRVEDCLNINITEQDVHLNDGDIIFIQSRENEVFYTGGLLGGGQYNLPRDHDIDILEAISIAQGRSAGQDIGKSALNNDVTISASQAIILRKLPNGSQVPILIDLYRARKYRAERMLIQRGDYIVLQYTKAEAIGAFLERHILESALFGLAAAQLSTGSR